MSTGWVLTSLAGAGAYLLGTLPSAVIVAGRAGRDPTREGSRNPGASNVYRLAGRKAGLAVLLLDVAKGVVGTLLGWAAGGRDGACLAGLAAVLGHVAPVTRRFRGGKGVATAGGMALVLWPLTAVALLAVFVGLALTLRIASVGSLAMAIGLPIGVAIQGSPRLEVTVAAVVAALVVARHHENIGRLVRGEERRTTAADPRRPEPTT